jgi:hypothetical protein
MQSRFAAFFQVHASSLILQSIAFGQSSKLEFHQSYLAFILSSNQKLLQLEMYSLKHFAIFALLSSVIRKLLIEYLPILIVYARNLAFKDRVRSQLPGDSSMLA